MFTKFQKTLYPPFEKPVLVWDGDCGFCKYWVIRWKLHTGISINYIPYQQIAHKFKDIPLKEFKKASRFIDTDGFIYSGPDSAYKTLSFKNGKSHLHNWYHKYKWFTWLSDFGYNTIAKNRSFMFKLSKAFFGSNPKSFKPYWILYLLIIIVFIFLISA
ncbi:hypothetical protein ULMS_26480 [Patiriisocius marinistellae]|uniref:Thiol-disulfide oxidoreductase n=1 Tax=Patiriisocius marinistellae TaxID=2494560 RepID=A0A5J4FY25_9FLAO|nr:DCC1-like thiol-disulfide oxidoreductase family protein [Patiriisocius marinistellae]GEQ87140.1 hypothetical protein ULMS_26480 [Patiriisocius marinistellae]